MDKSAEKSLSSHANVVNQHYDHLTVGYYIGGWSSEHIHFGLFEPQECSTSVGDNSDFDLSTAQNIENAVRRMVDVTVEPARIEANHHVVDAGCGVGGASIRLAKLIGCQVTGVNINQLQLDLATTSAKEAGLSDRVRFKWGDCTQSLPFDDESIDAVLNIESACHYTNRTKFLQEVFRILKPGGRIVAMDWLARDKITADDYNKYIQPICDAWALRSLENQSSYTNVLSETGFKLVEFVVFGEQVEENLKLLERHHQRALSFYFSGACSPKYWEYLVSMSALYNAWKLGHFELGRYYAEKPDKVAQ